MPDTVQVYVDEVDFVKVITRPVLAEADGSVNVVADVGAQNTA